MPLATVFLQSDYANAQLIPDTTVDTQIIPVDPDTSIIGGGATVEQNLFHSFEAFNIAPDKRVFFFSPTDVDHIFSRVTGDTASQIDGVLGTFGSDADLFLINPNGVVFGPGASLSVLGSFIATTADGVQLGEGGQFRATTPTADSLLAVSPSAFFFSSLAQSGNIQIDQSRLFVPAGEALVLLGGNVTINDSVLISDGGRLEMGAVATADTVAFSPVDGTLSIPDTAQRADIQITNGTEVSFANFASDQATSIRVYANNLDINNDAFWGTSIGQGLDLGDLKTGNIQINATGDVTLSDGASLFSSALGRGQSGDIAITAENLFVIDSLISSLIVGEGKGGDIVIDVNDQLTIADSDELGNEPASAIQTGVNFDGIGESGNVVISANNIDINNGFLLATFLGNGQSGDIIIDVQDRIGLVNGFISSVTSPDSTKNKGGDIIISANILELFENGAVITDTAGIGDAGDIKLNIRERIVLRSGESSSELGGTNISSEVGSSGEGGGGDIEIFTTSLELRNASKISTATGGVGDAGDIKLNVRESIVIGSNNAEGGLISSGVASSGKGDGGDIKIIATSLEVLNAGQINALTNGMGDAGNISIDASDFVVFDGEQEINGNIFPSAAFSFVEENAQGNGGNVEISTGRLEITSGAGLSVSTFSNGEAGNILINADDSVRLNRGSIFAQSLSNSSPGNINITAEQLSIENLSLVSTATEASVDGGNINLTLGNLLLLRDRSDILTEAGTSGVGGNGGNISIVSPFIVAIPAENSDIQANAFEGNGGQVNIISQGVFGIEPRPTLTPLSDITASSKRGVSGIIAVNALNTSFIQGNLATLPEQFINPDSLISNSCVDRSQTETGRFTITGDNLSETPDDRTAELYSTGTVQALDTTDSTLAQFNGEIIEPSGIYQTPDGRLVMGRSC
ncbi:filamentous hemagglutinin N-terminal domain-containing protein [Leptothoe spongobia TAU-MAC 1115]|uniref:Filamentous hemagglutinin N-terminal domain-containing protein n=1 Tax=Leptothoe spongobia TAU-MAC 1115 TaxID=1967444 RepID=A0A947DIE6_9CYAN|nr:filamentous hemagglutinin N-terminal domain-containing protein [Leptothoe spongobia TAU-MAC 1115]